VQPIRCDSTMPTWQGSAQPALATGKVRFVGEAVACVLADERSVAASRPLTPVHQPASPYPRTGTRLDPGRLFEPGGLGQADLVDDFHPAVTHPHEAFGLEAFEHPVDTRTGMADQFGEAALAQVQDAVLSPADED